MPKATTTKAVTAPSPATREAITARKILRAIDVTTGEPKPDLPMPKPDMPIQAKPDTAIAAVKAAVNGELTAFVSAAQDVHIARQGVKTAGDAEMGVRQRILTKLATLSGKQGWTDKQIEQGVKDAIQAFLDGKPNYTPGTLRQLGTEMRRAMHPQVREHVKQAFADAKAAWDAEGAAIDADKDAPKPLRDKFSRAYQLVAGAGGILATHQAGDAVTASDPELLAETRTREQREDPKLAEKALKRLQQQVADMCETFPHNDLIAVGKFLARMDAAKLETARKSALRAAKAKAANTSDDDEDDAVNDLIDE